ncbi:MAG: hypothetical protein ACOC78_00610 [Actinomycetota bacterium]
MLLEVRWSDIVDPRDDARAASIIESAVAGNSVARGGIRLSHKNGRSISTEITVRDFLGNPTVRGVVITMRKLRGREVPGSSEAV